MRIPLWAHSESQITLRLLYFDCASETKEIQFSSLRPSAAAFLLHLPVFWLPLRTCARHQRIAPEGTESDFLSDLHYPIQASPFYQTLSRPQRVPKSQRGNPRTDNRQLTAYEPH